MKKINFEELATILANTGETQITIKSETSPKMKKRGNPYADNAVSRILVAEYDFGTNYAEKVNEALDASGITERFTAQSLPWGVWKVQDKLIEHNGKTYARVYKTKTISEVYTIDGRTASESEVSTIKDFLQSKGESNTQSALGLEKEKQVRPQTLAFDTIVEITIGTETYEL